MLSVSCDVITKAFATIETVTNACCVPGPVVGAAWSWLPDPRPLARLGPAPDSAPSSAPGSGGGPPDQDGSIHSRDMISMELPPGHQLHHGMGQQLVDSLHQQQQHLHHQHHQTGEQTASQTKEYQL